jgi:ribosomal-protein-alanine N-acetyltransferase
VNAPVRLEPLVPSHAALVFDDLTDRALYVYIPDEPPASRADLVARFERYATAAPAGERWLNWIAFAGDTPVGHVQATVTNDRADVAWLIFPRFWRRGYGAAAVRAMLDQLHYVRAVASIDPRNAASLALARSVGFVQLGVREDGDLIFDTSVLRWQRALVEPTDYRGMRLVLLVPELAAAAKCSDRALELLGDALADPDGVPDSSPYSLDGVSVAGLAADALSSLGERGERTFAARLNTPGACVYAIRWLAARTAVMAETRDAIAHIADPPHEIWDDIARLGATLSIDLDEPATRAVGLISAAPGSIDSYRLVEWLDDRRLAVRYFAVKHLATAVPRADHAIGVLAKLLVSDDPTRWMTSAVAATLAVLAPDDIAVTRALLATARRMPYVAKQVARRSPSHLDAGERAELAAILAKLSAR